jgi:homoaconitase/3-isopropylmalate dehydratase large subunit
VLAAMRLIDDTMASYRVIEYGGDAIAALSIPERMTIAGLSIDTGAEAGIVPADAACVQALHALGLSGLSPLAGDADARPFAELHIEGVTLSPQVSSRRRRPTCATSVSWPTCRSSMLHRVLRRARWHRLRAAAYCWPAARAPRRCSCW